MKSNPRLDRQSFEAFLENAFEIQQSGLEAQSLVGIVEVQRFLAAAEFNLDRALQLIAERALIVCNASGIAIAMLESNQLVYRAGSGSAAIEIGRHVPAVLSACSNVRAEILRVEDAQNDWRVQAKICKQFGAVSLLILPIYDKRVITGVLQVHFSEAHAFLDREVRAYRMMAGLAEEAILRDLRRGTKEAPAALSGTAAVIQSNMAAWKASGEDDQRPTQAALDVSQRYKEPATDCARFGTKSTRGLVRIVHRLFGNKIWPLAATVNAGILLAIAIEMAHDHYFVFSTIGSKAMMPNKTSEKMSPRTVDASAKVSRPKTRDERAPSSAFRRVQFGPNEVDYVAEDVTIRHFTNRPSRPQTRLLRDEWISGKM